MNRIYNFSAGPAMLPTEVLEQAQRELLNWNNSGMSVMEVSHRGGAFEALAQKMTDNLRAILAIPTHYKILFMPDGGRGQFAGVPMNLLNGSQKMAYVINGLWGQIAAKEAEYYGQVQIAADSSAQKFTTIPEENTWQYDHDAAYLHYTDNETINGVEFPNIPNAKIPLVTDMSSNILSRPIDVSRIGLIYACSQKNIAPAGVTLVIIREDLLERKPMPTTPSIMRYALQIKENSMLNTPVTFSWYMANLVFEWIIKQGGVKALDERNRSKAKKLYDFIDQNDFYSNPIDPKYRSRMNVVFRLPDENLDKTFVAEAEKAGLAGLKGHRYVGGLRASIYNAMPEAGVDALINFMKDFVKKHG